MFFVLHRCFHILYEPGQRFLRLLSNNLAARAIIADATITNPLNLLLGDWQEGAARGAEAEATNHKRNQEQVLPSTSAVVARCKEAIETLHNIA